VVLAHQNSVRILTSLLRAKSCCWEPEVPFRRGPRSDPRAARAQRPALDRCTIEPWQFWLPREVTVNMVLWRP
jgi:hypothetical protein